MLPRYSISFLARKPEPTRTAPFFSLVSLLVILLLSLYPFSGWRFTGEPITAFFTYPLPYYFTLFDNTVNVLAYMPLGASLTLSLRKRWWRAPLAFLLCVLVSSCMEFTQQFLPGRVASNLDILSNAFGGLLGVMCGLLLGSYRCQRRWLRFRHQYLIRGAAAEWALVWLLMWLFTQVDPSQPYLGVVVVPRGLPQPFVSPIADPRLFLNLLEGGGMLLHLLGIALFISVLLQSRRAAAKAVCLLLLLALVIKAGFAGMLLQPEAFFAWLTPLLMRALLVGVILLWLLQPLRRRWRALFSALALSGALVVSWLWPLSQDGNTGMSALFRWHYGHLQHFQGLAGTMGELWPAVAILFMLYFALLGRTEDD